MAQLKLEDPTAPKRDITEAYYYNNAKFICISLIKDGVEQYGNYIDKKQAVQLRNFLDNFINKP